MKKYILAGYTWVGLKEIEDKTFLISDDVLATGYFDTKSNEYSGSKLQQYLNGIFLESLAEDIDISQITNGVYPITEGQYNMYVRDYCDIQSDVPWLLRTPCNDKSKIKAVHNGNVVEISVKDTSGIRPALMINTAYILGRVIEELPTPEIEESEEPLVPETQQTPIVPSATVPIPKPTPAPTTPSPTPKPQTSTAKPQAPPPKKTETPKQQKGITTPAPSKSSPSEIDFSQLASIPKPVTGKDIAKGTPQVGTPKPSYQKDTTVPPPPKRKNNDTYKETRHTLANTQSRIKGMITGEDGEDKKMSSPPVIDTPTSQQPQPNQQPTDEVEQLRLTIVAHSKTIMSLKIELLEANAKIETLTEALGKKISSNGVSPDVIKAKDEEIVSLSETIEILQDKLIRIYDIINEEKTV